MSFISNGNNRLTDKTLNFTQKNRIDSLKAKECPICLEQTSDMCSNYRCKHQFCLKCLLKLTRM